MSSIICYVSLKSLMAMALLLMLASWFASKKYYAMMKEQQQKSDPYVVAALTTITIFAGKCIWTVSNKIVSKVKRYYWSTRYPTAGYGSAPMLRAASARNF